MCTWERDPSMGPTEIYTAAHELHIFTTIGAVCCLAFKKKWYTILFMYCIIHVFLYCIKKMIVNNPKSIMSLGFLKNKVKFKCTIIYTRSSFAKYEVINSLSFKKIDWDTWMN